jgi:hypothetical protein
MIGTHRRACPTGDAGRAKTKRILYDNFAEHKVDVCRVLTLEILYLKPAEVRGYNSWSPGIASDNAARLETERAA